MFKLEGYESLANAIIEQAVSDYRFYQKKQQMIEKRDLECIFNKKSVRAEVANFKSRKRLERGCSYLTRMLDIKKEEEYLREEKKRILGNMASIEKFFLSDYMGILTRIPGNEILDRLKLESEVE